MMLRKAEEEITVIQNDSALGALADARSLSKGFWASLLWGLLKEIILEIIKRHDERVLAKIKQSDVIDINYVEL